MKYLFIDTETTGLPQDDSFSIDAINNWPRLVSVAYILCDDRKIVRENRSIIKPNGFIIPPESTRVHGITSAEAISKGRVFSEVLDEIKGVINECDYIVGHNVVFDINMLNAEFFRYDMTLPVSLKPYYCTMLLSKDYCGLPNDKYPTLEELYSILKGESIANAHNAMTDAHASMECFWILKDSGIVDPGVEKPTIIIYPTEDNISWAAKQVSTEYAAKAYAYLTFASNLLYNKSNFLKSEDDDYYSFCDRYLDSFSRIDDSILKRLDDKTRKEFEYYSKDFRCSKDPNNNSEWVNNMFDFLKEEILKTSACVIANKFNNSRTVVLRPYLRYHLKEIRKEYGGNELIEKFKLNNPESTYVTIILDDESSWVDIAMEAVKTQILSSDGMIGEIRPQESAENYFILMLEFFNNIRETERNKRSDEFNKALEKSLDPKALKESEELIKNYSSPYALSSKDSEQNKTIGFAPYEKAAIVGVIICFFIVTAFALTCGNSSGRNNTVIEGTDSIGEYIDSSAIGNDFYLEFPQYGFALDAPCKMEDVSSEVKGDFLLNYGGVSNGNDIDNGVAYQLIVNQIPVGYRDLSKEQLNKVIDKLFRDQLPSFDSYKKIKFGYEGYPGYEVTTSNKGYNQKGVMFVKDNLVIALTVFSREKADQELNKFTNCFKVLK